MSTITITDINDPDKNKIYLNPNLSNLIPSKVVIRRCEYCRCILGDAIRGRTYCSLWCKEMGLTITKRKDHVCECGNFISPYPLKKNGDKLSTTYPKLCEDCNVKRLEQVAYRKLHKKEIDNTRRRMNRKKKKLSLLIEG